MFSNTSSPPLAQLVNGTMRNPITMNLVSNEHCAAWQARID